MPTRWVPRAHTGHVSLSVVVRASRHVDRQRNRLGRSHRRRPATTHFGQLNNDHRHRLVDDYYYRALHRRRILLSCFCSYFFSLVKVYIATPPIQYNA